MNSDLTTPSRLASDLGISERRLRATARRIGACRVFGKTMIFTPDDVAKIYALSTPDNAAGLIESAKEIKREHPPTPLSKVKGYVYFIGGEDKIKIGFARNVGRRLKGLQTSCPFPLILLASFPGTVKREREMQERFASNRLSGEWFRFDGELRTFVEALK